MEMRRGTPLPTSAAEWFAALSDEPVDRGTRDAFTQWIRESPAHIRELLELFVLRAEIGGAGISEQTLRSWIDEAQHSSVENLLPARARKNDGREPGRRRFLLAAAAALACAAAGGLWWLQDDHYRTGLGEQRTIALQDGSTVSLNTNSRVSVELTDRARTVQLSRGEAYFEVQRDPRRPFSVQVGEIRVTAIGTAFNVRAAPEGAIVTVAEGKVEVRSLEADGSAPMSLIAGERAMVATRSPAIHMPDVRKGSAAAWMQGRIEFESATLDEVMREFARYRRVDVAFADETLRQRRITGSFNARDPEAALAYIGTLPDIRVKQIREGEFSVEHDAP